MSPRISAALEAAQQSKARETGLVVEIHDAQLNQWEYIAGRTIPTKLYADYGSTPDQVDYQDYRASAGMCKLSNGNIVRVRNGDEEDAGDRQIWVQTITDAEDPEQWETWSVLYSGTHYSCSIQPNGTAYVVYHSKADGIYRNNVLKWTPSSGAALDFVPVRGQLGAGWVRVLRTDAFDDDPVMDLYYTSNLNATTPSADENNYRWPTMEIAGIETDDGKVYRFYSENLYFPARDRTHGKTIWQQNQPSYTNDTLTAPYPIRGIGGGSGLNFVKGQQVCRLSDDFYYLFMTESRITSLLDNTPAWIKLWETSNVPKPSGVWFDPSDSANLRVSSSTQKKVYKIRQSDRVVLSTTPVLTTHAIVGVSGDPDDATIYWILEGPWWDHSTAISKIHKVRKSDDAILATYNLDKTRWTDIQASDDNLWLTNIDSDKIYKYSKAGVRLAVYAIYYGGVRQVNPTGTAYHAGNLYYFFLNSGRILKASETQPARITDTISTHGTAIYGGEFDDTGDFLFSDNNPKGKTYKFQLEVTLVIPIPEGGTNLGDLTLWIRSKDLFHWSAPVVGPGLADPRPIAGLEESGDFVYWADNGSVYRRPTTESVTDLTNYTTQAQFEVPRDNQEGQGTISVANPDGINDDVIDLADQGIIVRAGIRTGLGQYEFVDFNRWWVKRVIRDIDGPVNRLKIQIVDLWDRLSNPLQDVYNIVGKTEWRDWFDETTRNEAFNYYFVHDTKPVQSQSLRTNGDVLYTGWKGHNPDYSVQFFSYNGSVSLLGRYVDSSNFIRIKKSFDTVKVYEVVAGVSTLVDTTTITDEIPSYSPSTTDTLTMRAVFKWRELKVYLNGTLISTITRNWENVSPGYAGFGSGAPAYSINHFTLSDWEYNVQLSDLIKTALSLGDVHDAVVTGAQEKAYALIWGPQTDIPTAAEALRQFLISLKLGLAYRGGVITVDKFTDVEPLYTFEDTIFESSQDEEPEDRPNWISIDGNENFWLEVDVSDSRKRGRQNVRYFDLPELLTIAAVKARAREELRRAVEGQSPGGGIVLPFDLWRMDPITWIDNTGNSSPVRVEGFEVTLDQGKSPSQRMKVDTSLLADTVDD